MSHSCPEICCDILRQSHVLIAGSTGSGKSVLLNSIITTALWYGNKHLILIDPKRVELNCYRTLPVTMGYADTTDGALDILDSTIDLMEKRYKEMQRKGLKSSDRDDIYLCIDELADLMISPKRKEILVKLQKLLQLGRAAKIHVIACTQIPNRKIIPAELTLNFTARMGLHTESAIESKQIINAAGCETLPMYGYGIYKCPGKTVTYEIPFTDEDETVDAISYNRKLNR